MSGIAGIWNRNGEPVASELLAALSDKLAHRGKDGGGLWIQGAAGLACQLMRVTPESLTESQPYQHASGVVVVFDGRLDNRKELSAALGAAPGMHEGVPDACLIATAYQACGEQFPQRLSGDFALGLFDPAKQRLILARDPIGVRPLYFSQAGDAFLFASEIKALLVHPRVSVRPNEDTLARLILGGVDRDDPASTCFQDIFSVPPASTAIVDRARLAVRRYWDFDPTARTRLKSFPDYAEAFREHFELAVRRRMRSAYPVAVSVSGGLDSSSIFCTAETLRRRESGRHPPLVGMSYTYAQGDPSDEQAFLLDIERTYGVTIARFPSPPSGFVASARYQVWRAEAPVVDVQWSGSEAFFDSARSADARVMLTGHWGDQMLFDQAYLVDRVRSLAWIEVGKHLRQLSYWCPDADPQAFRRQFLREIVRHSLPAPARSLLVRLHATLRRGREGRTEYTDGFWRRAAHTGRPGALANPSNATAHAKSFYSMARSNFFVFCMEWQNKMAAPHGIEMSFPFLDRDLIAFLMSIPGEMLTLNGVYKGLLREAMQGVLPSSILRRRGKADFTQHINAGFRREFLDLEREFGRMQLAIRQGCVRGEALPGVFAMLRANADADDCIGVWRARDLLALEAWFRVFLETGGSRPA